MEERMQEAGMVRTEIIRWPPQKFAVFLPEQMSIPTQESA